MTQFFLLFLCIGGAQAFNLLEGYEINKRTTIENVSLATGRKDDVRVYEGVIEQEFNHPIALLRKVVGDFENRCNNEHKDLREIRPKDKPCLQENNSLIESTKITELKNLKSEPFKVNEYLLSRRIYNRNYYNHYDLITEREIKNKGQLVVTFTVDMLTDEEASQYLGKPAKERESAFIDTYSVFTLKEIAPNKTLLTYRYTSKTDHWLLNKSMVTSRFFNNTSKNINKLFSVIDKRAQETSQPEEKVAQQKQTAVLTRGQ